MKEHLFVLREESGIGRGALSPLRLLTLCSLGILCERPNHHTWLAATLAATSAFIHPTLLRYPTRTHTHTLTIHWGNTPLDYSLYPFDPKGRTFPQEIGRKDTPSSKSISTISFRHCTNLLFPVWQDNSKYYVTNKDNTDYDLIQNNYDDEVISPRKKTKI